MGDPAQDPLDSRIGAAEPLATPPPTANAPAASAAIELMTCAQCGLKIHTQQEVLACPSCKTPTVLSMLVSGPLERLPRQVLRSMERGARLVGTATLLWTALLVVLVFDEILDDTFGLRDLLAALALLSGTGSLVLLPLGILGLTATISDFPELRLARVRTRARRMAVIGLVVAPGLIGIFLPSASAWLPDATWAIHGDGTEYLLLVVFAFAAAVFPLQIFAWLRLLASLCERSSSPSLVRWARPWWFIGAMTILPFCWIVAVVLAWSIFSPPNGVRVSAWIVGGFTVGHGAVVVWLMRAAIGLRRAIARARETAPETVTIPRQTDRCAWRRPRGYGLWFGLQSELAVPRDACAGCGYDLAGLADDAPCPECSLSAIMARTRPTILAVSSANLLLARTGLLVVGWSLLAIFAVSLLKLAEEHLFLLSGATSALWWARSACSTLVSIFASLGMWRAIPVAFRTGAAEDRLRVGFLGGIARAVVVASVPAVTIGWIVWAFDLFGASRSIDLAIGYIPLLWVTLFWLFLPLLLHRLSTQVESRGLYRWSAWLIVWGVTITLGTDVIPGIAVRLPGMGWISWVPALWSAKQFLTPALHCVAGVIALRLASRLKKCAAESVSTRDSYERQQPVTDASA